MTYKELTKLNLNDSALIKISIDNYTYDLKYILVKAWFNGLKDIEKYNFELKEQK